MKAIITRFHGATETKGARLSARDCDNRPIFRPYGHTGESEHAAIARAFIAARWPRFPDPAGCRMIEAGGLKGDRIFIPLHPGETP